MSIKIKLRTGVSNLRDLRADLLTAAYDFADRGIGTTLILRDCKLSPTRLSEERRLFALLAPEAAEHISIQLRGKDEADPLSQGGAEAETSTVPVKTKRAPGVGRYNIQNILLLNWLHNLGPKTVKALGEASGTVYPTTAAAINDLAAQGVLAGDN